MADWLWQGVEKRKWRYAVWRGKVSDDKIRGRGYLINKLIGEGKSERLEECDLCEHKNGGLLGKH